MGACQQNCVWWSTIWSLWKKSTQAVRNQYDSKKASVISYLKLEEESKSNLSDEAGNLDEIEQIVKTMWLEEEEQKEKKLTGIAEKVEVDNNELVILNNHLNLKSKKTRLELDSSTKQVNDSVSSIFCTEGKNFNGEYIKSEFQKLGMSPIFSLRLYMLLKDMKSEYLKNKNAVSSAVSI